ncbi:SUKH-3 domain-containing protein [Streptomyces albicerus]|uniref:SUKH-3 domain-containing protein n=1 Tax=Streptomyces albicerus TaxID=2569859 RepID=UPI001788CBBE|nr:SUKH-3 domain-containing protein [Streptomyces albicerus]
MREVLEAAGWAPGRKVDTGHWRAQFAAVGLPMHEAAELFLAEFGGLSVRVHGPGISCARTPFEFDPELAVGEEYRFSECSKTIGRHLFPLGELDEGRHFLGIDEFSEIYLVELRVGSFGRMPEAMENLVLGVMPRRLAD